MSAIAPDGVSFENWIGRSHAREDALTPRIAAEFEATFVPNLARVSGAPLGLFWTLAPDIKPAVNLGQDAHPKLGMSPLPRSPFEGLRV